MPLPDLSGKGEPYGLVILDRVITSGSFGSLMVMILDLDWHEVRVISFSMSKVHFPPIPFTMSRIL